jgi:hypothetical protein
VRADPVDDQRPAKEQAAAQIAELAVFATWFAPVATSVDF